MAGTVVMALEGVLQQSEDFSMNAQPHPPAMALYGALATWHRMVVLTSHPVYEQAEHWLKSNGVREYDQLNVITRHSLADPEHIDVRRMQITQLRGAQTDVTLVIDRDPLVIAYAMSVGLTGLLYAFPRPASGRIDLQPRRVRDWSAIEGEIDLQRELRS